jgi:hypothetical protein
MKKFLVFFIKRFVASGNRTAVLFFITLCSLLPAFLYCQVDTAWVRRYNGPGNGSDYAYCLAVDSQGNVYVTGGSNGSGTGTDYATIKYKSNGDTAWVRRYNGLVNGNDQANYIMVDRYGNVYVTGYSDNHPHPDTTNYDYVTIKYDSSGVEQWAMRYNGPCDSSDEAYALAVDYHGNIYVTGRSVGSGTNYDYATIKYDEYGNEQWVQRYNGPGNEIDGAKAIIGDSTGNVYVTGGSVGSGTSMDYATIKYDEYGNEQWVRRYNGPLGHYVDCAYAIAIDNSNNVYVTGESYCAAGSGHFFDYVTIKYDVSGDEQWVAIYSTLQQDQARSIAVDGQGNVYVTGNTGWYGTQYSSDIGTVKYDSTGVEQWVARFDGWGAWDEANDIAVDGQGNVYVTGYCYIGYITIKYSSFGSELWRVHESWLSSASSIAVDEQGNVYVTGGLGNDYTTIKYVQTPQLPDLELLTTNNTTPPSYLYLSNISVLWGTNYTEEYPWTDKEFIGAVIRNTGSVAVNNVLVRFYVDGQPIGDTIIDTIMPGDTCVVDRIWDLPDPVTENKLVEVRIDPDNTIQESNEDNNNAAENVSIYYAKRTQNPIRHYDLRTDAYGQFSNFDWNSYDALWVAFQTLFINPFEWTPLERLQLGVLFPLYALRAFSGGHCYGMSATSIHYFDYPSMIPPPYTRTFDLTQEVAQNNINRYHMTQFFDVLYAAFLSWLTNPSQEYTYLYQSLRNLHEPAMLIAAKHATSCYKMVERGSKKLSYVYDNNDSYGPPGVVTTYSNLGVFDLASNIFSCYAYDRLNYKEFSQSPENYPHGFPYYFWDDPPHDFNVLVRRPRLELGDWARVLLEEVWRRLLGQQIAEGKHQLTIACPVRGLITDNYDRRIGFVGDSLVNEIPGATIDTGFTVEIYNLPDSLTYSVNTAAYDTGKMSIGLVMPLDTNLVRVVTFDTIPMLSTTRTEFSFTRTDTLFQMEVDWDSNGVPDTILNPNFNDTMSVPQVAVKEPEQLIPILPLTFSLSENAPNPFKSQTIIRYSLPKESKVSLLIYDVSGKLVKVLVNGPKKPGVYNLIWNGTDDQGKKVAQGVYFYALRTDNQRFQKKMLMLK